MRPIFQILSLCLFPLSTMAEDAAEDTRSVMEKHVQGAEKLADEQDELSADVQQLVIEQTVPEVIELLNKVEDIMGETTDYLAEYETGGKPIAAQTEVIEKIHEAAKARQKESGSSSGSAMMDMMERMMGKKEGEEGEGKKGEKPGDKPGQGQTGDSDAANTADGGDTGGKVEERRIPKAAGKAGKSLPTEFQEALDAYNRGMEGKK